MMTTVILAVACSAWEPTRTVMLRPGKPGEGLSRTSELEYPVVGVAWQADSLDESVGVPSPDAAQLRLSILEVLTRDPDLDDVEVAHRLGANAFEVSAALRALAEMGLVEAL